MLKHTSFASMGIDVADINNDALPDIYVLNAAAFGSKVHLYYGDQIQYLEHNPFRGYQSTVDAILHFGLGEQETIDSLTIEWPNGQTTTITNPSIDTLLEVSILDQTLVAK